MVWIEFALCILAITFAGVRLSRYGDAIADKTGLGGTWIGVIMLASVTSLPELVTGISSVMVVDTPDIALGDILGSCVFNLLIIVLLDALHRPTSLYSKVSEGHIVAAAFGVMMIGFVAFSILLSGQDLRIAIGHVGIYTPIIIILYLVSMRTVFLYERNRMAAYVELEEDPYPTLTLSQAIIQYMIAALIIVVAGSFLPYVGQEMAVMMGWHESFVGTLFIAFATSLPEVVVTVAALRLGAVDMAIGNLLGSNLFNIAILAVDDLLYLKGPLFADISISHSISAVSATMMTGVAIIGLFYRSTIRVLRTVGWVSIFLFCAYMLNTVILYLYAH
ncbi:MAG: sodium/calcium exchanger membrane protein [marine bacterium B5-7]|nr:MAG: sodium/calcium exchanger membrane protein [marine bacterium B5-7]